MGAFDNDYTWRKRHVIDINEGNNVLNGSILALKILTNTKT